MANKHMINYSTLLIIKEVQIKCTTKFYHIPTKMAKIKKINTTKFL